MKRLHDVVQIFARVRRAMPARLLLVGDGVERRSTQALVDKLGLQQDVCFLGTQDNVIPILSAADLFLLPSEKESFGLGALEAMACGVPLIASSAGGIPEVVVHGENGYLAAVGDVEAMSAYAVNLLKDEEKLQQLRASCAAPRGRFFDSELIVRSEAFYRTRR